jgi:NAD(P)-dependent dehydrogenase (short-subunit alcohol dehydrogenase family)
MDLGLQGKVAIVTGGSEGIGRAAAERFCAEGAAVTICARRADVLERAADDIAARTGGSLLAIAGDVRRDADVADVVGKTAERFGGIDILVNNAGASLAFPFLEATDAAWQQDLDIKLFGAIRFVRAVIPHMRKRGGGRIINMTTVGGKAPEPRALPTTVSRAAGINLTKSLALELAAENILVNTICLGILKSAQWERTHAKEAADTPIETWYREVGRTVPIGRIGEAAEAADLIAFLASDRAAFITGAAINLDGGAGAVV